MRCPLRRFIYERIQRAAYRLSARVWVPAFAGNAEEGKGPHPTLSHRERAKNDKALAPFRGRGPSEGVIHGPLCDAPLIFPAQPLTMVSKQTTDLQETFRELQTL